MALKSSLGWEIEDLDFLVDWIGAGAGEGASVIWMSSDSGWDGVGLDLDFFSLVFLVGAGVGSGVSFSELELDDASFLALVRLCLDEASLLLSLDDSACFATFADFRLFMVGASLSLSLDEETATS
jgi:hypothetical protein